MTSISAIELARKTRDTLDKIVLSGKTVAILLRAIAIKALAPSPDGRYESAAANGRGFATVAA